MTIQTTDPAHDPGWLVPEPDHPLPAQLHAPTTMVDWLRRLGWEAAQDEPDGDRFYAACAVLACLRVGPLIDVVDALAGDLLDEAMPDPDHDWQHDDDESGAICLPVYEQGQPIPRDLIDGPVLAAGFVAMARGLGGGSPYLAAGVRELGGMRPPQAAEWLVGRFALSMAMDDE